MWACVSAFETALKLEMKSGRERERKRERERQDLKHFAHAA